MDAAQALADLTEVSTQIEGAVLAKRDGKVVASTFPEEQGTSVAAAAVELLAAAEDARAEPGRTELTQVLAATAAGAVFVVRDERHLVAAVTAPEPTVGLVFYDLKTSLRLLEDEKKPAGAERTTGTKKKAAAGKTTTGAAESGDG